MKKYTTLFFDLDDTVLDFKAAEKMAIKGLFDKHGIGGTDDKAARYSAINQKYWEMFESGIIAKEQIYWGRFKEFLETENIVYDYNKLSDDYYYFLSEQHPLIDSSLDVLMTCKRAGYMLCATTNGVSLTQHKRISEAGLDKVFDYIVISEDAGYQKPKKEYFDFAMKVSCVTDKSKVLIIGDSQSSDILGGINSGIDTCWYNPKGAIPKYKSNYEINDIRQIIELLCK